MDRSSDNALDALAQLEDRIHRTLELVGTLRRNTPDFEREREALVAEKEAALREAADARARAASLEQELESLRSERHQVRTRIEKLLGQLDLLSQG